MAKPKPKNTPTELAEVALVDESPDSVAKRTFVSLSVALGFLSVVWFLYLIRSTLVLLLIAMVIALALSPTVAWLERKGLRRGLASALAVVVVVVGLATVVSFLAPTVVSESDRLGREVPRVVGDLVQTEPLRGVNERFDLDQGLTEAAGSVQKAILGPQTPLLETIENTLNAVLTSVVILALSFFMLLEGPRSWEKSTALLKPHYAGRLRHVGGKVVEAIGGFVWGNLIISLVAGTIALLVLLVFGVPYAVPLALIVGILALIPIFGSTIATVVMSLVALTQGPTTALGVFITYGAYQLVESNVVVPLIYARTLKLSPLVVLVATIIGGTLGGIIGVLLAIPAAAVIQIIVVELLQGTGPGRRAHIHES